VVEDRSGIAGLVGEDVGNTRPVDRPRQRIVGYDDVASGLNQQSGQLLRAG
jgi:hypothetical protein